MSGADVLAAGLLLLAVLYAVGIGAAAVGLRRVLRPAPRPLPPDPPFVTVVVPARDEADVVEACLASILACAYPPDRFEVIVVDDLSEDATPALVRRVAGDAGGRVRLLQMPENLERARAHKKRAIEKGIAHARGALILTTDADCTVPPAWIAAMAAEFVDVGADPAVRPVTAFVSGPVVYTVERPALLQMQALEFLGLVSLGAGMIGAGRPVTCNGANVAYRKDVFEALGGFSGIDHLTSGDDELLMQKVARETPHRVAFCGAPAATVVTAPVRSAGGFLQQRRRWASKSLHYPSAALVAGAAVAWLFHAALLASAVASVWVPALRWPTVTAFLLALAAEAALLAPATVHFGRGRLLRWLPVMELLRVPYFVYIGPAGLVGGYQWKGRRVHR